MVGELPARHVPDVQLHARAIVRSIGHAVAAAGSVAQDELHILAGVVAQRVVGGQLQLEHDHVVRLAFQ